MHYIVIPTVLYFFKLFDTKTILEISEKKELFFLHLFFFLKGKYYFQNQLIKTTILAFIPLLSSTFKSKHEK